MNAARILAENGYQVLELGTGLRGWAAAGEQVETILNFHNKQEYEPAHTGALDTYPF